MASDGAMTRPEDQADTQIEEEPLFVDDAVIDVDSELNDSFPQERLSGTFKVARAALLGAGALWVGAGVALFASRDFALPSIDSLPQIASFLTPLALIPVGWLLLNRTSTAESARFAGVSAGLRREADALDMRMAIVNQQIESARATMAEQARLLEDYGEAASASLKRTAGELGEHAASSATHAETILQSVSALGRQLGQIIDSMPTLEKKAAVVSDTLSDGSQALVDKVERLEAKMEALVLLTEEARSRSLAATKSLTAQLSEMQSATRGASEELTGMAELSSERIGTAVDRVKQVMDETGLALDARMADLNLLVDQSQTAMHNIGGKAVTAFGETIDSVESRLLELNRMIEEQTHLLGGIDTDLSGKIQVLGDQLADFEAEGIARGQRLGRALDGIGEQTSRLDTALQSGGDTIEALIARSEMLLRSLDSNIRQIDVEHPATLDRLNVRVENSRSLLASMAPEIEGMASIANALFSRAHDAEELLRGQSARLTQWLASTEGAISENRSQLQMLEEAIHSADEGARRLTDSAGPQLVAALLRVKDTAEQASERARQALAKAISESANELGDATEAALRKALGDKVNARIEEITAAADRAVQAAAGASDRLTRQLLSITDSNAQIEDRLKEAEARAQVRNQESFSRRSSMLIETLNNASIDIVKALAMEVSDNSWGAYIKGDRGVFTRRAVRLLDTGQAQSIATLYDGDALFRDQVNRYIQDFEAMLRAVLASPESSTLGVTILSSDVGKLYVALAQAIDRLRG